MSRFPGCREREGSDPGLMHGYVGCSRCSAAKYASNISSASGSRNPRCVVLLTSLYADIKLVKRMGELTDTEKQLALLVIREMEKNQRSIQDLQKGAQDVLDVFRKVTAPERPNRMNQLLQRMLFPFGRALSDSSISRSRFGDGRTHFSPEDGPESLLATPSTPGRPHHHFLTAENGKMFLVVYAWADLTSNKISRIRVLVEMATEGSFDTIAGEAPGPFEDQDAANAEAIQIAIRWFERADRDT